MADHSTIPNGRRVVERCKVAWLPLAQSAQKRLRERGCAAPGTLSGRALRRISLYAFLFLLATSHLAYAILPPPIPSFPRVIGRAVGYAKSDTFAQMALKTPCRPIPDAASSVSSPGLSGVPAGTSSPNGPFLVLPGLPAPGPPIVSFDGVTQSASCGPNNGTWTSDASGAIGPSHYMQSVNFALTVYDRKGNVIAGPVDTQTFWKALSIQTCTSSKTTGCWDTNTEGPPVSDVDACNGNRASDAVVLYDRQADRWIVSRPGERLLCLAVSETQDPKGIYYQYAFLVNSKGLNTDFDFSTLFVDYPKLGIWPDAYYATGRPRFPAGIGNTVSAFERAAMLRGDAIVNNANPPQLVTFFVEDPQPHDVQHSTLLPADLDGKTLPPKGSPGYVVQVRDSHLGFRRPSQLWVYEFHVNWINPLFSDFFQTAGLPLDPPPFPLPTFDSRACPGAWPGSAQDCIVQPTTQKLDALDHGTLMYRLSYRNLFSETLLLNQTVSAVGGPNQNQAENQAGIHWYELRKAGDAWGIYQQGIWAPDDNDRWLGSVATDDAGNIALGFSVAGTNLNPSIHYVGRQANDTLGELLNETSLIDGAGVQQGMPASDQFGDYSQMTVDPRDDCTFWYTNTYYAKTTSPDSWHTRIGAFRFPTCLQFIGLPHQLLEIDSSQGAFVVQASYALKSDLIRINPLTEDVTLQIGTFSITIPAGSFNQIGEDSVFMFEGVIGSVHLAVNITSSDDDSFFFEARGVGATGLPTTNPVTLALTIGADQGTNTVRSRHRHGER